MPKSCVARLSASTNHPHVAKLTPHCPAARTSKILCFHLFSDGRLLLFFFTAFVVG